MAFVVDISALLGVIFPDEDGTYAANAIKAIGTSHAVVPTLFWFEIRNALIMGERRQRITATQTSSFLADLALLPFEIDDECHEAAVFDLARLQTLTIYDAAYLELAQRKNLPLATLDRALIRAASATSVRIWEAD